MNSRPHASDFVFRVAPTDRGSARRGADRPAAPASIPAVPSPSLGRQGTLALHLSSLFSSPNSPNPRTKFAVPPLTPASSSRQSLRSFRAHQEFRLSFLVLPDLFPLWVSRQIERMDFIFSKSGEVLPRGRPQRRPSPSPLSASGYSLYLYLYSSSIGCF
ncbi:hypothetical protein BRADI_4g21841v3 [Brachypodium distachyon]|uniref:Uncharacterized protein n=1 Tax=Brachypodium distachyon TaxID=15368 RepID=A0A2K2CPB6_BRADI|nr:hypothetical protein BRADI_4g21841v3 [Brachypodium distachyon]